jgi:hypothetical protein
MNFGIIVDECKSRCTTKEIAPVLRLTLFYIFATYFIKKFFPHVDKCLKMCGRLIIGMGKGSTNDELMLDHFHPDEPEKYIITADRGYESYDLIFFNRF